MICKRVILARKSAEVTSIIIKGSDSKLVVIKLNKVISWLGKSFKYLLDSIINSAQKNTPIKIAKFPLKVPRELTSDISELADFTNKNKTPIKDIIVPINWILVMVSLSIKKAPNITNTGT